MAETLEPIDHNLVTVGQPTEGGCVWIAFDIEKATLPKDATTAMSESAGFVSLGDLSEDGFTEKKSRTKTDHKNWNKDIVLTSVDEDKVSYTMAFIEPNRPAVAKLRYGSGNVQEGEDGSVSHISGKLGTAENVAIVVDELESGGFLRRTVIGKATVDAFDDVPHQKGSLLVYGCEITAIKGKGNYFDVYRAKPSMA